MGFAGGSVVRNLPACRRPRFDLWIKKIPRIRTWKLNPVFLPRKSQGQRSLRSQKSLKQIYNTDAVYLFQ